MKLSLLIDAIRNAYVDQLAQAVVQNPEAHVEPALRNSSGELAMEGPLKLPYRADLMTMEEGLQGVDSVNQLQFSPIHFEMDGCTFCLHPFYWDALHICIQGAALDQVNTVLYAWFIHAFDTEDQHQPNEQGLFEVIHFMSDPIETEQGIQVVFDLGSASTLAWDRLLESLLTLRPSHIEMGETNL